MQRTNGVAEICKAKDYADVVTRLREDMATYNSDSILRPDFYVCIGGRMFDVDGTGDLAHILMIMEIEVSQVDPEDEIIVVAAKNQL